MPAATIVMMAPVVSYHGYISTGVRILPAYPSPDHVLLHTSYLLAHHVTCDVTHRNKSRYT